MKDIKKARRFVNLDKTSGEWKRQSNRRLRRAAKVALQSGKEIPRLREVSSTWDLW